MKNKWYAIGCLFSLVAIIAMFCFFVMIIDGLTYGGLFKNEFWYEFRKLWTSNG